MGLIVHYHAIGIGLLLSFWCWYCIGSGVVFLSYLFPVALILTSIEDSAPRKHTTENRQSPSNKGL
jgi:hypothetical protein